jgi:hypothetical protein
MPRLIFSIFPEIQEQIIKEAVIYFHLAAFDDLQNVHTRTGEGRRYMVRYHTGQEAGSELTPKTGRQVTPHSESQ